MATKADKSVRVQCSCEILGTYHLAAQEQQLTTTSGGDQQQLGMMMDIMYGNHHSTTAVSSSDIMFSANTGNYFPAHSHAAINNQPSANTTPQQHHSYVEVFPITRSSQATAVASVSPAIVTSTAASSGAMMSSSTSSSVASNVTSYSPNLYSPSAIEYGITTTGSPNGPAVDYDAFYHHSPNTGGGGGAAASGGGGGGLGAGSGTAESNIISTDSGLSYTNLDGYMYGNQGQHPCYSLGDDCSPAHPTNTPPTATGPWLGTHPNHQSEHMLIHNHLQSQASQGAHQSPPPGHLHHHHHHPHANPHMMHPGAHLHHHQQQQQQQNPGRQYHLDATSLHHQSIQNSSNLTVVGSGSPIPGSGSTMHPGAQMGPHSPQQQQQHLQQSNSNQSSVQQFKWMQIKRNVPKPSGESSSGGGGGRGEGYLGLSLSVFLWLWVVRSINSVVRWGEGQKEI